jgi:hypothetical protein
MAPFLWHIGQVSGSAAMPLGLSGGSPRFKRAPIRNCASASVSTGADGVTVFHVQALGAEMTLACASSLPPSCFLDFFAELREASCWWVAACRLSSCWREEERDGDDRPSLFYSVRVTRPHPSQQTLSWHHIIQTLSRPMRVLAMLLSHNSLFTSPASTSVLFPVHLTTRSRNSPSVAGEHCHRISSLNRCCNGF